MVDDDRGRHDHHLATARAEPPRELEHRDVEVGVVGEPAGRLVRGAVDQHAGRRRAGDLRGRGRRVGRLARADCCHHRDVAVDVEPQAALAGQAVVGRRVRPRPDGVHEQRGRGDGRAGDGGIEARDQRGIEGFARRQQEADPVPACELRAPRCGRGRRFLEFRHDGDDFGGALVARRHRRATSVDEHDRDRRPRRAGRAGVNGIGSRERGDARHDRIVGADRAPARGCGPERERSPSAEPLHAAVGRGQPVREPAPSRHGPAGDRGRAAPAQRPNDALAPRAAASRDTRRRVGTRRGTAAAIGFGHRAASLAALTTTRRRPARVPSRRRTAAGRRRSRGPAR